MNQNQITKNIKNRMEVLSVMWISIFMPYRRGVCARGFGFKV